MAGNILLKISTLTECYDGYNGGHECDVDITCKETTLAEMLKELSEEQLIQYGLIRLDKNKKNKISATTTKTLKDHGWFHEKSVEDASIKKALKEEFFVVQKCNDNQYSFISSVDISNLDDRVVNLLLCGGEIVQVVDPKSVLTEEQFAIYNKAAKEQKAKKDAQAKAKKEKLLEKKQKEIEKAKKLLQEAGVLKD